MIHPDRISSWRGLESEVRRVVAGRLKSSADVDDVVQEVLLRVDRGPRAPGWVHRTTRNAIIDHQRVRARTLAKRTELDEEVGAEHEELEPAREVAQCLLDALPVFMAELSELDREALRLVYFEGRPQVEVARTLGISVSTVKSRVQRSRARLRVLFEECCTIALDARNAPISCRSKSCTGPTCDTSSCE